MPSTSVAAMHVRQGHMTLGGLGKCTFLLQEDAAFSYYDWHVSVDIALAFVIEQTDGDVRVSYAGLQWDAEDALWGCTCCSVSYGIHEADSHGTSTRFRAKLQSNPPRTYNTELVQTIGGPETRDARARVFNVPCC